MKNKFLGITGVSLFLLASCFSNIGEAKNRLSLSNKNQIPTILAQRDSCNIFRYTTDISGGSIFDSFTDLLIYSDGSVYYRAITKDSNDILVRGTGKAYRENDGTITIELITRGNDSSTLKFKRNFREVTENGRLVLINEYDHRYYQISGSCRKSDFFGS